MDKLVLASRNPHKIEEMTSLLAPMGIEVLSTQDFPELEEVVEDKDTLEGNALKKSIYVAGETGLPALSDDTGLEVDALNGAPGVWSARYAGEDASYSDNVEKLLAEMKGHEVRSARFRTVMALSRPGKEDLFFEGSCEGYITEEESGDGGFGYDPVFMPEGYNKTFAELSPETKNSISHRGRAMQNFLEYLKEGKH